MHYRIAAILTLLLAGVCPAIPIVDLPGYAGVVVIERSDFAETYIFAAILGPDPKLTTRLTGPLTMTNRDFGTSAGENYDIFFSDADGTFNALGEYISIEARWIGSGGPGGGLNIDAVSLVFNGNTEYASFVASFLPGSQGGHIVDSELKALGVEDNKATTMGFTTAEDRMRITLGFPTPSPTPEPGTWALMGAALLAGGARRYFCR